MDNTSYISLARATSLQRRLDVIAHNIANMNTTGYKKRKMVFSEFLVQAQRPFVDRDVREYKSVIDERTIRDVEDGTHLETGNPFDLALSGTGFFKVAYNNGVAYTRAGNFALNANNELTTIGGRQVLSGGDQPILIPQGAQDISITQSGQLFADGLAVGQLEIVQFDDLQDMESIGDSLMITTQEEQPAPDAVVRQGKLEQSNVNPILEMTRMIDTLRTFQANQKMIEDHHSRQRTSIRSIADPKL
ncbi:MAG: flagellar basal-body rod protein FlgF [Pseudomonadota bacterium]